MLGFLLLTSVLSEDICISGRDISDYVDTPIIVHPDVTLHTAIGGNPLGTVYFMYARVQSETVSSLYISISLNASRYECQKYSFYPGQLLGCYFFIPSSTTNNVCNRVEDYSVQATINYYGGGNTTNNVTFVSKILCGNDCARDAKCGGCGTCDAQCNYCSGEESFEQCAVGCDTFCRQKPGGTTCDAEQIYVCLSASTALCNGMCDVCNVQESTKSRTMECYYNWSRSCGNGECEHTACNYTNSSPKDNCEAECRKKCYMRESVNYCPFTPNYHPKRCYSQCTMFCGRPSIATALVIGIMGSLGVAAIAVLAYKGMTRQVRVYSAYDM